VAQIWHSPRRIVTDDRRGDASGTSSQTRRTSGTFASVTGNSNDDVHPAVFVDDRRHASGPTHHRIVQARSYQYWCPMIFLFKKQFGNLPACSAGAVAVVTALVMPLLLGFTSLGIEVGHWYLGQRTMQGAADAAAISAAAQWIADQGAGNT